MAEIRLGTSSFTATGWRGSFYPKGLRPGEYLSYYAQHFDTVEIDSTFCATPSVSVVRSWNAKIPEGFLFAAKVPQLCDDENYVAKLPVAIWTISLLYVRVNHFRVRLDTGKSREVKSVGGKGGPSTRTPLHDEWPQEHKSVGLIFLEALHKSFCLVPCL